MPKQEGDPLPEEKPIKNSPPELLETTPANQNLEEREEELKERLLGELNQKIEYAMASDIEDPEFGHKHDIVRLQHDKTFIESMLPRDTKTFLGTKFGSREWHQRLLEDALREEEILQQEDAKLSEEYKSVSGEMIKAAGLVKSQELWSKARNILTFGIYKGRDYQKEYEDLKKHRDEVQEKILENERKLRLAKSQEDSAIKALK